ncbi:hypothetical protein, partial [Streptomyces cyaneofuscatus]|uniref:hypothetical protein n=1 Tax=Streptomyces cyaneofuscatus TaxID=66883 RepID=UPI003423633A
MDPNAQVGQRHPGSATVRWERKVRRGHRGSGEFEAALPVILGSLLDLTVKVRATEADIPSDL